MKCKKCGVDNPDEAKFCRSCGTDFKISEISKIDPNQLAEFKKKHFGKIISMIKSHKTNKQINNYLTDNNVPSNYAEEIVNNMVASYSDTGDSFESATSAPLRIVGGIIGFILVGIFWKDLGDYSLTLKFLPNTKLIGAQLAGIIYSGYLILTGIITGSKR